MSRGKFRQSMQSSGGTPGRCQSKDKFENVEIIDLDSGDADVEIIDAPGSSHDGSKFVRKEANTSPKCVISIDDDDDDDDSSIDSHAETSGNQYFFPRNRYGLDCTSETESFATGTSGSKDSSGVGISDGENSDCEIIDDSSGSIRQEWERAHLRKTMPPDRAESTRENVKCHFNKSFQDSFDYCFSEYSNWRNKFGEHGSTAFCGMPNAESSKNNSKAWYEKEYGSFVPGMYQEEIRERVPLFYSEKTFSGIRPCSNRKRESFASENVVGSSEKADNGVRSSEKVGEEIAEEADNGVKSPGKAGEEIVEEADNGVRSPEKVREEIAEAVDNVARSSEQMNVDMDGVQEEANFDIANQMNDEGKEKCEPSEDVESSLMRKGDVAASANKHVEKIGEDSALVCVSGASTDDKDIACFVGERERHKESAEYRRAAEAEWASRQEQLRIQVCLVPD